jgi:tryptophan synthase alpha chain
MTPIAKAFKTKTKKSLFIPYFSLGDPLYSLSSEWGEAILSGGADLLELGIPFSDPIGDGPVIQRAFTRALMHPFSWDSIFPISSELKKNHPKVPLIYMSYFNPIYQIGTKKFLQQSSQNGVNGLILPDLPHDSEENAELFSIAKDLDMDVIHLVTPATTRKRIKEMKKVSSGFVYYVTSFGVTGERNEFPDDLKERVAMVREELGLPVCCGFGISTPEHAAFIGSFADGVIVGSAFQRIIEEHAQEPALCKKKLYDYTVSMRNSCP